MSLPTFGKNNFQIKMKFTSATLVNIVTFLYCFDHHHFFVSCCAFHKNSQKDAHDHPKIRNHWDQKDYSRKLYPTGCQCGTPIPPNSNLNNSWLLFVHAQRRSNSEHPPFPICTGTIITSNLVATSHECLIIAGNNLRVYETWNFVHRENLSVVSDFSPHVVKPSEITLATSKDPWANGGPTYKVKDIILNTRYAVNVASRRKNYMADNLALLLVDGNLFEKGHNSICLPAWKDGGKGGSGDAVHQLGLFYDLGQTQKNTRSGRPRNVEEKLVIMDGKDCDREVNKPENATDEALCVRYIGYPVEIGGGPLVLPSTSGQKSNFVVGIASEVKLRNGGTPYRHVYFTNIFGLVKYIEFYAQQVGSLWCKQEDLKLGPKLKTKPVNNKLFQNRPSKKRDESLDCACGIRNDPQSSNSSNGRVAGGIEAVPYEFPWMVRLILAFGSLDGKHFSYFVCGGTLINDRVILTAAHCISEVAFNSDVQAIEDHSRAYMTIHYTGYDQHAKSVAIADIYYHPEFLISHRDNSIDYDIALLILSEPLQFSTEKKSGKINDLRPICLATLDRSRVPSPGTIATVAGWGLMNPDDKTSAATTLQKVDLPILPRKKCQDFDDKVNDNMICAGYLNKHKDAAGGDSGGPLMVVDKTHYSESGGQFFEIGIVSFGQDYKIEELHDFDATLGVYTNVQNFIDFVDYYSDLVGAKWCKPP